MPTAVMYENVFEEVLGCGTMCGVENDAHGALVNLRWRSAPWRLVSRGYYGVLHSAFLGRVKLVVTFLIEERDKLRERQK